MVKIQQEVIKFLQERREMCEEGFPYCYVENFIELHCNSCIDRFRKIKKIKEKECEKNATLK